MHYFAFGSNMWVPRIEARLDRCIVVSTAWMDGWALRFHKRGGDGSGKCDAFRTDATRDRLHGIVYELSASQKSRLDDIEGSGYTSHGSRAMTACGELDVVLYTAVVDCIDAALRPFDWYLALVAAGAAAAGLPAAYVRDLQGTPCTPDPDHDRTALNRALLCVSGQD